MNVVAIIQARMGSTRLPGKVLKNIGARTMLARVVRRIRRASHIDEVVVATTTEPADAHIVAECETLRVSSYRGSEEDVLDRYYETARAYEADVVVRITSDCPFIDPGLADQIIEAFHKYGADYTSISLMRSYPRGLGAEVTTREALERAWEEAEEAYQRVHVTPYLYEHPERFDLHSVTHDEDLSYHRWTVDTADDLTFARAVYERFDGDGFSWQEVLRVLEKEPELMDINNHVEQKSLEEG